MPQPVKSHQKYFPALDGIRALAVIAVIFYHMGIPGVSGGLLGVGIFFTLSGYLITGLLLKEYQKKGAIDLVGFWIRRLRRLMPTLIAVLAAVILTEVITGAENLQKILWTAFSGLLYFANWATIAQGQSYFDRFAPPGPLDHLWSLAIEEQFYIVWPLLFILLMRLFAKSKAAVYTLLLLASAVSFYLLWALSAPGFDNTRAYEGTDTRAGGLLLGALVALILPAWRHQTQKSLAYRLSLDGLAVLALSVIGWLMVSTDDTSLSLYSYELLVLTLAVCVLLVTATAQGTFAEKVLGAKPLAWVGERSYGLYLWHMPVIAFSPNALIKWNPYVASLAELGVTFVLAMASWTFIENPIRIHGLKGVLGTLRQRVRSRHESLIAVGAVATLVCATSLLALPQLGQPDGVQAGTGQAKVFGDPAGQLVGKGGGQPSAAPAAATADPSDKAQQVTAPAQLKTKCENVVHIGDSTSVGLMDEQFLPDPADRVDAQYKKYGAQNVFTDIQGGHSIIETPEGTTSVSDGVDKIKAKPDFHACWVIAMGTNEVANIAAGSNNSLDMRIDTMMEMVGDDPVMWPTVRTIAPADGYYDETEMQKMTEALVKATKKYPNLYVYDWAQQNKNEWYQGDGIHFTTPGYQWRGKIFARALATAFPATGESPKDHVFALSQQMIDTP